MKENGAKAYFITMEFANLKMGTDTLVATNLVKRKERANLYLHLANYMKGNGWMENKMAKEFYMLKTVKLFIVDFGDKASS
jgi:hypothetical protein